VNRVSIKSIAYISYLLRVTQGVRSVIILRTLLGIARIGLSLAFIWFSKTTIDCATGRVDATTCSLATWFILMVACMLFEVLISQCVRYIETRTAMSMNNRINRRLFNILMTLPLFHGRQRFHSGDMLNRLTLDVRTVSSFAISQLPTMVVMLIQLIASAAFLAYLNPWLAAAPVVIMPLCLLAGKLYFRRQRRIAADIRQGESDAQVTIQEGLKHRIALKSLECIGEIDRRLAYIQQQLNASNREQAKLSAISGGMARIGFAIGFLTAFGVGVFSLKAGIITFGTMTAFIQLVNRIQNPIAGIAGYIPSFVSTSVAIDRLREIDMSPPDNIHVRECRPLSRAGVRVHNISFRYEAEGRAVLSSFSHDFAPGSRTMIVGSTGVGKTTLIKLLLGLLKPDTGRIEIYGEGISHEVSSATLCNFTYVPQGNSLLHGSIRDNLLLASPTASDEQLEEALRTAAADFVFDLPLGLDTSCDEAGAGLSEGQAQRIAIARALLRPGAILLFDEFNSALDTATATTLMQRLCNNRPDSTIIIIAHHRTAIAPYCNTILPIT
jgi:hypothetical protein BACCOPRO_03200